MKKELKDYLHLYLGCEVIINNALYENRIDTLAYMNSLGDCGGNMYEWLVKECQPILRPLSDLTDEERNNAVLPMNYGIYALPDGEEKLRQSAEITKYLLSKHFDLFKLIEEGLAADKTKLNLKIMPRTKCQALSVAREKHIV